ncbi:hypothetical protein [Methylobacterium crusticola]|uniref:hypothetical protein n=1 Tax=Methylobacterium crusticola TaxID=1697972 RepID=UPI000FFC68CA|nr:hypothetical protein [Methylobacterium crusticola]
MIVHIVDGLTASWIVRDWGDAVKLPSPWRLHPATRGRTRPDPVTQAACLHDVIADAGRHARRVARGRPRGAVIERVRRLMKPAGPAAYEERIAALARSGTLGAILITPSDDEGNGDPARAPHEDAGVSRRAMRRRWSGSAAPRRPSGTRDPERRREAPARPRHDARPGGVAAGPGPAG